MYTERITPRERILTALHRRQPDRVPVLELSVDWNTIRGLGCHTYFDLIEHLDLDAVSANQVQYQLGLRPLLFRLSRTYTDRWGVRRRLGLELLPDILAHPIRRPEDLRHLRVPDPRRDPAIAAVRATARRFKGRRAVFFVGRDAFADAWNLCGLENLLASFVLNPGFAEELIRAVKEYNLELHRQVIRAGADFIVLGDDYAHKTGTLMSPEHFRRFILPGFAEIVRNIKDAGALCVKHTDGNVWAILESLVATGLDGVGPLEPGAGMDLSEVKHRFGGRVCVIGNVDVDLLCRGSEEEVRRTTRSLLERVSPGGGHILSSGNSITSAVKPANFLAMVQTARDFGRDLRGGKPAGAWVF